MSRTTTALLLTETKTTNNMQQLTAEDKARVFAQYLGSEVKNVSGFRYAPNRHSMNSNRKPIMSPSLLADFDEGTFQYDWFKLILCPISKITDEDAIEVCKLADNTIDENHVLIDKDKRNLVKGMLEAMEEGEFPYHIADFLRSRSYMLPYKGVDLFEAGIAIEEPQNDNV